MTSYLATRRIFWRHATLTAVVVAVFAVAVPRASAVMVTYEIGDFSTTGFSASFLHAATGSPFGAPGDDQGKRSGATTSSLVGLLKGDLADGIGAYVGKDVFTVGTDSSISGTLGSLTPLFGFGMASTPIEIKLTGGALVFETAGPGEFTGGFLDYELFIDGSASASDTGTFFFQDKDQGTVATILPPNRGTPSEFTLWGNNYMHNGHGYGAAEWDAVLSPLGYTEGFVGGAGKTTKFGIDLHGFTSGLTTSSVPEPSQVLAWSMLGLALCGFGYRRRKR